jgi:ATP-binding cassette subfamily B protein
MSMQSWSMLRSIQTSDRVKQHQLKRGTTRRILRFAAPYRRDIAVFLVTVVVDAGIGVATPLLAGHVVNAITGGGQGAAALVVELAIAIALLAVAVGFRTRAQRRY